MAIDNQDPPKDHADERRREIAKLKHDAQMARSVLGEQIRRIRVYWPNESFIVDVWRGRICGVTGTYGTYLGQDEADVANELRALGAKFQDVTGAV